MSDSIDKNSRRAFLGTAGILITGLAGCTSTNTETDNKTTTKQNTTTDSTRATSNTYSETTTETSTQEDTTSTTASKPQSLVYASTETTDFGINLKDNPLMGSPNAPVDLYYWSDYQCPFCNRFEQDTFPKLLEEYIKPGKVRLVILEYVTIGDASKTAARMAKCVWRQVQEENPDAFKRWHASIFDAQKKPNSGWAIKQNLLKITEGVKGVDANAVESCLPKNKQSLSASVAADKQAGKDKGVNVTPTFIFDNSTSNGMPSSIQGAQPYPRFEATIKEVMK
ncbi:DsbA family protein [Haladaptatus paucihalophilus]|uniref:Protein-disulfide isomerase n=1 Tax=Haladaptatus paucihalophilus DX253 TaxID=797209 RepID=A0A1M7BW65_HALPU|nr:DsbA family protein [Haladaptatus paucihalophilus]SHL59231.1 Protein-disulfide isomerase [Haladaptatus paucihalophilus DX253]